MDGANMVYLQHPRASHYFRILLREQSIRRRVLTHFFHPPSTPRELASKPELWESYFFVQTPLSLMKQV